MYGIKDYVAPVAGKFRVTSGEGNRKAKRTVTGAMMSSFHHGVDIAGATPGSKPDIRNVTAGKVVWTGKAGGWGNAVIVQNPDGYTVQYGHLDSIAVKVGDQVPAGGKIGVMGATGNVTGVHLDMIVTKNGQSIKRDGTPHAPAPASIAKRAGGKIPASTTATTATTSQPTQSQTTAPVMVGDKPQMQSVEPYTSPTITNSTDSLFGGQPINLLQGSVGLAVPQTSRENQLFGGIAGMNLDGGLEQIYAEAARAIGAVSDSISSQPMIQSNNPLRSELRTIFDRLEV